MRQPTSRTRPRLLLAIGAGAGLCFAAGDVALVTVGHAAQDDSQAAVFSVYNGQVSAGADRETATTEKDVGLPGGAVNNYYPDTRVDVALAGTGAEASSADTGPLAQAVLAGQGQNQPQYVRASYPGVQSPPGYRVGPATADASAGPASALATGTYGAVGNTTTVPTGAPADGSDGLSARSTAYFDSALGFVTIGDARVHHASYGGGMLTLDNVHVSVKVGTLGADVFSKEISVSVGSASVTVNGTAIPVTIDQNGVTVQQQNAPFDQVQSVSKALNDQLKAVGITVHAVAPLVTQQGDNLHVEAEGVVVSVQQIAVPGVTDGIPKQSVQHTLGEVVMDNEALPAPPQPVQGSSLPAPTDNAVPPTDLGSSTTTVITNTVSNGSVGAIAPGPAPAATAPPATPAAKAPPISAVAASALLKQPHPGWLLFAYLAWQALLIALAGAVYLHRSALRRAP
jgi:hypothetical protein